MKGTMRISEFARKVGLHPQTIRNMIKRGELKPHITPSGQYRFTEEHVNQILGITINQSERKVIIYARISTKNQSEYITNQIEACRQFLITKGYDIDEIITDVASSFNFKRKGLRKLIDMVINNEISVICIYSKDRLTRIAFELLEYIFSKYGVKILVVDKSEYLSTKLQLKDAIEELVSFIHYITSKIYGSRSYKKRKIDSCVKEVISDFNN